MGVLVVSQSLSVEGERIHALCHDLRQHLAAGLMLAAERPGDELLPPEVRRRLERIEDQLRAVTEVLSAETSPERRAVDLSELAEECARTTEAAHGVVVEVRPEAWPVIRIEPGAVRRAITNLLDNAARASASGTVHVTVRIEAGEAVLEIDDDGAGFGLIPSGSGVGLAQVRAAAAANGGRLELGTSRLGGTLFRLLLPDTERPGGTA